MNPFTMTNETRCAVPAHAAAARKGAARARSAAESIALDIAVTLSTLDTIEMVRAATIERACAGDTDAALALLGFWE